MTIKFVLWKAQSHSDQVQDGLERERETRVEASPEFSRWEMRRLWRLCQWRCVGWPSPEIIPYKSPVLSFSLPTQRGPGLEKVLHEYWNVAEGSQGPQDSFLQTSFLFIPLWNGFPSNLRKTFCLHVFLTAANSEINVYWNIAPTVAVERLFQGLFVWSGMRWTFKMFYLASFFFFFKCAYIMTTLRMPRKKCVLESSPRVRLCVLHLTELQLGTGQGEIWASLLDLIKILYPLT